MNESERGSGDVNESEKGKRARGKCERNESARGAGMWARVRQRSARGE